MLRKTQLNSLKSSLLRFIGAQDLSAERMSTPRLASVVSADRPNMARQLRRRRTRKLAGHAGQTVKTTWF